MIDKILPLGTVIQYIVPKCPCDGGGWDDYEGKILEFHKDKLTYYRTDLGHVVMKEWIRGYGNQN